MFADDIVLIAENEFKLQCLLDVLHEWCVNWEVQINPRKTQVVHFRKKRKPRSLHSFSCGPHSPTLRSISTLVFDHVVISAKKAVGTLIAKSKTFGGEII